MVKGDYFTGLTPAGIIRCLEVHDLHDDAAKGQRDNLHEAFLPLRVVVRHDQVSEGPKDRKSRRLHVFDEA